MSSVARNHQVSALGADPSALLAAVSANTVALAGSDPTRVIPAQLGGLLVELQGVIDSLVGVAARWTGVFEEAGGHEDAGSATLAAWMRQHLRLTASESRKRTRAGHALGGLPATFAALQSGEIAMTHVDAIADGIREIGPDVMATFEDIVLEVARECDADAVRHTIRTVRDTLNPDAADAAYVHSLDRRDVTVSHVGEGYVVRGFLDAETGAMFHRVLYSVAKPADRDDDRTAGQRRVDGLRETCRSLLDHGLPSDRGLRPHLFVTVSADRLAAVTACGPTQSPGAREVAGDGVTPASLLGFGRISDRLLSKLACDCAVTPIVVDATSPYPNVLDVGRTSRLATTRQRLAITVQQGGTCFSPGCDNTHLEIHHMVPWSVGGETNLRDLRGYCTRCHHLIHLGLLVVSRDGQGGWRHDTKEGRSLLDRRRRMHRLSHAYATAFVRAREPVRRC